MPQVLVVDDDHGIRVLLRDVLTDAGCGVLTASDLSQAIQAIEEHQPDLLVLDLSIPGESEATLRRVTGLAHHTKVLVLSGSSELHERAQDLGAHEALAKPFDIDELVAVVQRLTGCSACTVA
ncbi:MAG: response regulator [Dehalococcoidia bacterium]